MGATYRDVWYRGEGGLTLYARDYACADSRAPALLCMHGLTRNSADFDGLASQLCGRFRVIAADQRGRGRSDYDPDISHYSPVTYVQDMLRLLDHLGLQRVGLVGTSMGGLMAFIMGSLHPDRVAAMVINDIGPEVDPAGLARIKGYVGKTVPVRNWEEAVAQVRAINGPAFPDFSDDQWLDFAACIYRERDGVPVLAYDPEISRPMADAESGAVPTDLWPLFEASPDIPMLVLRGAHSDILSARCLAEMRQRRPGLQVAEIPGRGHAPTLTEPTARAAIDDFLQGM